MDKADAEPMALYQRACELRMSNLAKGLKPDEFSADMMAFCWPGLQKELREREVAAGRTLTGYAQSQCLDCYGTGIKTFYDADGKKIGARPGCTHEHVDAGERDREGMASVEAAMHRPVPDETAADICSRVRQQLAYTYVHADGETAQQAAWSASRTWAHAEKYCREIDAL